MTADYDRLVKYIANMLREIVLKIGSEGGSLTILRERQAGNEEWRFCVERNETALYDLLSEEDRGEFGKYVSKSGFFHSFGEALTLLDRYPWFKLYPVEVHPEFLDSVIAEVGKRGGAAAVARWRQKLKA